MPFFFLRPQGFCKGPEYTIPYIQLEGISKSEALRMQKEIRKQMHWQEDENFTTVSKDQFSIHFVNRYDRSGKIDNSIDWSRILVGFEEFFRLYQKNWRKELQVPNELPERQMVMELQENNLFLHEKEEEEPNK